MTRVTEKLVLEMYAEGQTLKGSDLQGLNLNRTVMPGIDLSDADLRGANFRGANITRMSLQGAKYDVDAFDHSISV